MRLLGYIWSTLRDMTFNEDILRSRVARIWGWKWGRRVTKISPDGQQDG